MHANNHWHVIKKFSDTFDFPELKTVLYIYQFVIKMFRQTS